nr:hypothetical protein PB20LOC_04346 [Pectobacterium parmentieri]
MGALRSSSAMACGWPPGFGSVVRCGAQLAGSLCYQPRHPSLALTVWPPSLAALISVPTFSKHQRQQNRGVVGLTASSEGLYLAPPQPRCTGCARLAVARSLLVPVLAISAPCGPRRGPPCLTSCLAGLASPRPADALPSHRQAAERLAPR